MLLTTYLKGPKHRLLPEKAFADLFLHPFSIQAVRKLFWQLYVRSAPMVNQLGLDRKSVV